MTERRKRHANAHTQPPPIDEWSQRVGALTGLPALVDNLGIDAPTVVAAAGLAPEALASADNRIPYDAFGRLLQTAARMTGYAHFGLAAGRMWHLEDLGIVGELARNATDIREALQFGVVHQHLDSEGGLLFLAQPVPCRAALRFRVLCAPLGYAGVSAFMRSFRRWTGASPGQLRKRGRDPALET